MSVLPAMLATAFLLWERMSGSVGPKRGGGRCLEIGLFWGVVGGFGAVISTALYGDPLKRGEQIGSQERLAPSRLERENNESNNKNESSKAQLTLRLSKVLFC